tara:strand:+ start:4169 stop:4381 length:213 start_codon:yes stop_codon:yes gene_type:complete
MSISKTKNLTRRLQIIEEEATAELNRVCESSHWQSLGFIFFDQLDSKEKIAKANFYYGQLTLIKEINQFI